MITETMNDTTTKTGTETLDFMRMNTIPKE